MLVAGAATLVVTGTALWVISDQRPREVDAAGALARVVVAPKDVASFTKGPDPWVLPRLRGSEQLIAGTITVPPGLTDEDYYAVFVINEQTRRVAQDMWGRSHGEVLARGWDGRFNEAAEAYSWLAPAASIETSSGWQDPGTNVAFGSEALSGPIEFVAVIDALEGAPDVEDITVGLAAWDDDGDLAWAAVLPQDVSAAA